MNDTETQLREALRRLLGACDAHIVPLPVPLANAMDIATQVLRRTEKPEEPKPKHPAVEAFERHHGSIWSDKQRWLNACKWAWNYAADTQCEPLFCGECGGDIKEIHIDAMRARLRQLADGI